MSHLMHYIEEKIARYGKSTRSFSGDFFKSPLPRIIEAHLWGETYYTVRLSNWV